MKVEKLSEDKLKREFSIIVPANDIEVKITAKLTSIGKTAKVPGFRPGKIPTDILRKKYIKDIMGEVLQDVVTQTSAKALSDNKIKPALQPNIKIEEFDEGKDLKYKMSLEIMPAIPSVDLSKVSVTKYEPKATEEDLKELRDNFLASQKDFKPVKRAAKNGDAVLIDFKGFVDDVAFPGGEAMGHQLELGSNSFIPGFEEQLVGVKAGDETKVNVKFPDEYHSEDLKGKNAVFEIKVHEVQQASKAELNEEFAKKLGFESVGKFEETLKQQIESDGQGMARVLVKKEIFDVLDDEYDFETPVSMIEAEQDAIVQQIKGGHDHNAENSDSPDHNHQSKEEIIEEYGYLADRRVKLGLLITEIGTQNKVQVSQEDVNKAIVEEARKYPGQEMQVFEYFKNNPEQQNRLKGPVIEEKVVDLIIEKANVKKVEKSISEIRNMVLESNKEESNSSKKKSSSKKKVAKKTDKKSTAKKKPSPKKKASKKVEE